MYNPFKPPAAPPAFGQGKTLPEGTAPLFSKLIFQWLAPFLEVGFSRPLEKEDFWELPKSRLTDTITDSVEANFYLRCPPEKRPRSMRKDLNGAELSPTVSPESNTKRSNADGRPSDADMDLDTEKVKESDIHAPIDLEKSPEGLAKNMTKRKLGWLSFRKSRKQNKAGDIKYDESLFKAILKTFWLRITIAGSMKLFSDTLKTTTPLLNKVILTWLTESYTYARLSDSEKAAVPAPRGIGYGVGLAVALFVMQEVASLMTNHYMQTSMTTGLSIRTGIVGSVFRKSLRISGRSRMNHSVGQITTMISTDATRLDRFSNFSHVLWVAPIQIAIGFGLLIGNLGASALVGLGVLLLAFPVQVVLVKIMFTQRKKGVKITDKRIRMTTEVLQGIRLLKFYSWEDFYVRQIGDLREQEIRTIGVSAVARSLLVGLIVLLPTLASILSFITYALSGHDLNIAIIFSSLQLFNIIRMPLIYFPIVLASLSDALVAIRRIGQFLIAEDLAEPYKLDCDQKSAIDVDVDFTWETTMGLGKAEPKFQGRGKGGSGRTGGQGESGASQSKAGGKPKGAPVLPTFDKKDVETIPKEKEEEKPFELKNLKFSIPKGSFVGIVGRVGSGKSSVLQGLIGEMRRTRGEVVIGGSIAYVPQTAWIRNATLRENILFGQDDDDDRFKEVVRACNLEHDIEMLPHRENTEIGEKGINLSGGQKARVSLARSAYSSADIILLDDPLAAVDAYVGRNILEQCLLNGPLADRTRVLVTHSLHVLDKMDYIYVMDNGSIIEQGTYNDLMTKSIVFSRIMDEYGNLEAEERDEPESKKKSVMKGHGTSDSNEIGAKKEAAALMQKEERNTGSVTWDVYRKYLGFAGGVIWVPFLFLLLTLTQGAQVATNLFLGFWTAGSIHGFRQGDYMGVYAALGVAQGLFQFFVSVMFAVLSLMASLNLFKTALWGVLRSPSSFFDTTPMGRIMSRLSKDQDTLDTELATTLMQFLTTFSSVLGTIALVFYTFPLLGIIFAPMSILYFLVSMYYRRSSVETKRLDSLMRSALYGSYSETLTGLSTIRAYGEEARSIKEAEQGLDMENRAYYMTISIQRWLSVRLDLFGNILIFGIGLFAAGFRTTVNPSKIGVVLSYTLTITQTLSEMVAQFAQNEQNMNAVERVLHYTELDPEGVLETPNDPPPVWPSKGEITFTDVELAYRDGLPLVLKGISFNVTPGEKVGIVGRTGAGKSSLLQALFRTVELQSGKIEIDAVDIANIGLNTLRSRLALVPQDTTLFLGTLRDNLDPQGLRTDAELIEVLQRSWLLPRPGTSDPIAEAKFSLDSTVGDEGSNFSAGEKQLLALCRALVKNSRIIVLDEATSSVDVETDAKIQQTIQTEFATSTLLCIAHRLNTIAYYDRVLVMDAGEVAEFDTVLHLFDKQDSIFRSLCDEAGLSRLDIERIRADHAQKA